MAGISEESIRRVIESTNIVDLIQDYVPLKRAGSQWKGVCPFHNDTHPSMTVSDVKQRFMCFACNTGGDAVEFVKKIENLSFTDVIRKLADRAGIVLIESIDAHADRNRRVRKSLVDVNNMAAEYFHRLMKKSPAAQHARDYLKSRGYNVDMANRWTIGWAPSNSGEFMAWARSVQISKELLVEAGLVSSSENGDHYCRFRDRLMFPIRNERGECVAFSGRILGVDAKGGKYVNSPETSIFRKSNILFGLDQANHGIRVAKKAVLCEGQLDVIACHEVGVNYAVASQGTAFTKDHASLLSRRTNSVVICYDADAAGIKAADAAFKILSAEEGMSVFLARLPKGDDPDSFIKREGVETFVSLIGSAQPFFEARIDIARESDLLTQSSGRSDFALYLSEMVAHMKNPLKRDVTIVDVATRLQVSPDMLRQFVGRILGEWRRTESNRQRFSFAPTPMEDATEDVGDVNVSPVAMDSAIGTLCQLMLVSNEVQTRVCDRIEELLDPMEFLSGGEILRAIMMKKPDVTDSSAVSLFLHSLPPDQKLALDKLDLSYKPDEEQVSKIVEQACGGATRRYFEQQRDILLSSLRNPNLSEDEKKGIVTRTIEIGKLLSGDMEKRHS